MATTTNFGWETPDDTDLVKDGAAAMRTLGNSIDTSFVDLKGGTSGQILSKASNTDLDYTWIDNQVGDITSITATSPLTGGGTGGDVTVGIQDATTSVKGAVQLTDSTSSTSTTTAATPNSVKSAYDLANGAIAKSLIDAAGDLIIGTADNTAGRLAIGTTGQVLTVAGGTAAWAAPSGGGKILQVVQGSIATTTSTSSSTYADTGVTATITPSATSSKVLILVSLAGIGRTSGGSASKVVNFKLQKNSSDFVNMNYYMLYNETTNEILGGSMATNYLDSPSSTSALTYKVQWAVDSNQSLARLSYGSNISSITLMEIGA